MTWRSTLDCTDAAASTIFERRSLSTFCFTLRPAKERTLSLRTSKRREAEERVRVESVKFDQEMAEARRLRDAQPKTSLSQVEIERICAIFRHQLLEEDDSLRFDGSGDEALDLAIKQQVEAANGTACFTDNEVRRTNGMSDREFIKAGETIEIVQDELKEALARGNTQAVQEEVDILLEELGIELESCSQDYAKLSLAILKTYARATDELALRQAGAVIETPPALASFLPVPRRRTRTTRRFPRSSRCTRLRSSSYRQRRSWTSPRIYESSLSFMVI